ncbi:hypothetical protein RRG08_045447 [Elysia crispata]|uniref:Uncharacterized protein n=1 Tax=Elysia crispata TaxID=231223 RepID=A0AAE1AX13_9GAST|nr:hypothetical protein RRG08_045447 [Elysia crispata]
MRRNHFWGKKLTNPLGQWLLQLLASQTNGGAYPTGVIVPNYYSHGCITDCDQQVQGLNAGWNKRNVEYLSCGFVTHNILIQSKWTSLN